MLMSGTLPVTPGPSTVTIRSTAPTLISIAQSLKEQRRTRGGQRWSFDFSWVNHTRAEFMPILAFLIALRGQFDTFTATIPGHDTPQGTWAGGTPLVDGASQTGRAIALKGFTASQTGVVKAGDFLKFGDTKVYMATADANSDGSGKVAALAIEPALIVSPANNEAVVYTAVPFTLRMAADMHQMSGKAPVLYDFSAQFTEAY